MPKTKKEQAEQSVELADVHSAVREAILQERSDEPGVVQTRAFADAAGSPQIVIERGEGLKGASTGFGS